MPISRVKKLSLQLLFELLHLLRMCLQNIEAPHLGRKLFFLKNRSICLSNNLLLIKRKLHLFSSSKSLFCVLISWRRVLIILKEKTSQNPRNFKEF